MQHPYRPVSLQRFAGRQRSRPTLDDLRRFLMDRSWALEVALPSQVKPMRLSVAGCYLTTIEPMDTLHFRAHHAAIYDPAR